MMKYIINKSHRPSFDYHLILKKDEIVIFERKPTDSPGWVWCTNKVKKSCWIPESWLEIAGDKGKLKRDYNSKELKVDQGEAVEKEYEESGWVWVKTSRDESGWIPLLCIV